MKNNIQKAINEETIKYYSYCRVGRQAHGVSDKSRTPSARRTGSCRRDEKRETVCGLASASRCDEF